MPRLLWIATLLAALAFAAFAQAAGPPAPRAGEHLPKEAVDEAVFDNCFVAGTLVAMADGTKKPIEQVRAGDRVKACDPLSGGVVDREVVRTFRNVTDTVVDVTWAPLDRVECMPVGLRGRGERHSVGVSREGEGGEDGEPPSAHGEQTVRCTPGHPWWVESQQRWVFAGDLSVGDLLKLEDGRVGVVLAREIREEVAKTFNFEVEGLHTYFVGGGQGSVREASVLVHNMSKNKRRKEMRRHDKKRSAAERRRELGADPDKGHQAHEGRVGEKAERSGVVKGPLSRHSDNSVEWDDAGGRLIDEFGGSIPNNGAFLAQMRAPGKRGGSNMLQEALERHMRKADITLVSGKNLNKQNRQALRALTEALNAKPPLGARGVLKFVSW